MSFTQSFTNLFALKIIFRKVKTTWSSASDGVSNKRGSKYWYLTFPETGIARSQIRANVHSKGNSKTVVATLKIVWAFAILRSKPAPAEIQSTQ